MPSTTYPSFNERTEALEVASKFPDQIKGKTILVTGVNLKGVGFATAEAFASQSPSTLILAGRTLPRIQECIDVLSTSYPSVTYRPLIFDLSSQAAVRNAAAEVLSWNDIEKIDIQINNAAMMNIPTLTLSPDGLEIQFATNHLGHFLLTNLLMPKLLASPAPRVVNVTSLSPTVAGIRWSDINFSKINKMLPKDEQPPYEMHKAWGMVEPEKKSYLPLEGYNQSQVANVLFSIALTKRLYEKHNLLSVAVHPGVIETELGRYAPKEIAEATRKMRESGEVFTKTLGAGASTSVVAAVDPGLGAFEGEGNRGVYLMDCQVSDKADPRAVSSAGAERLWALSEGLVGEKFVW